MMIESIWLEKHRGRGDEEWRRGLCWVTAATALALIAVALAWSNARSAATVRKQLAIVAELQVSARDVSLWSFLALTGDAAAAIQLRSRFVNIDAALALLIDGGTLGGEALAPTAGTLNPRLNEFATQWKQFKRRTDALLGASASAAAPVTRDPSARRGAPQRPGAGTKEKAPPRDGRGTEISASAVSLLIDGHALAAATDGIRADLDGQQASTPWLLYLAIACALAAVAILVALGVGAWRHGRALQRAAGRSNAAVFEVLRPAMKTLHIDTETAAAVDPVALGRRLSAEVLVVIDGIKTLVKTLEAATTEANKFTGIAHGATRALMEAERRQADSYASLQATVRRTAAAHAALSTGAAEAQQQSAKSLESVGTSLAAAKDSLRRADEARDHMRTASKHYAQIATTNSEIAQSLLEVADLLTQSEGLALRAGNRLAGAGANEAVAFANELRGHLGPCVAMVKRIMERVRRFEHDSGEFSGELANAVDGAVGQSRAAGEVSRVLANADVAIRELLAKVASLSRLASGSDATQLLSMIDEIVRRMATSSSSARQAVDATKNASERIEALAKLLAGLRPS